MTGVPGLTSCASVTPNSASAFCWQSAAASVTGVIAPISVKGVMVTGCPCSAMAISPSAIASSKSRGEFTEMIVITPGDRRISSTLMPRAIAIMLMPSTARPRPMAVQWKQRSLSVMFAL
jgi:hypothetical protein